MPLHYGGHIRSSKDTLLLLFALIINRIKAQQFYVDDFLASAPTPEAALCLIDEGISRFKRYGLKLCKVQSNSDVIRQAYPSKSKIQTKIDLAPCDPLTSEPANGKSLGLQWDIEKDKFSIKT